MKKFLLFLLLCIPAHAQKVSNLIYHNGVTVIDWLGAPAWVIVTWNGLSSSVNAARFEPPSAQFADSKLIPIALGVLETRANCPSTQFVTYTSDGINPFWYSHGALTNGILIRDWNGSPIAKEMKWMAPSLGPPIPTVYSFVYLPPIYGNPCGPGYLAPELCIMLCRFEIGS